MTKIKLLLSLIILGFGLSSCENCYDCTNGAITIECCEDIQADSDMDGFTCTGNIPKSVYSF